MVKLKTMEQLIYIRLSEGIVDEVQDKGYDELPDDDVEDRFYFKHGYLPVVENGKAVGIVAIPDFVKTFHVSKDRFVWFQAESTLT